MPSLPRSRTPSLVPLCLFAACASPPATPLPLLAAFPTVYEGRIQPAAPGVKAELGVTPKADGPVLPGDSDGLENASMYAWLVQLPAAEAHAVLDGWARNAHPSALGFGVGGRHVDRDAMLRQVESWEARGMVRASPFLTTRLGRDGTIRVATQSAAIAGFRLQQGESALMLDPEVQQFEHGTEIVFRAERRDDEIVAVVDWQHSEMLRPRANASVDGSTFGSMEVPVQLQQHLSGETKVAPRDAMVLGVMPTSTPDAVLLLCLETETPAATPAVATVAAGAGK